VAVLASAGTNLVVFLPIAFMKGMIGKFFYSFGLTVIFVTIFSLLISFTLTPMLCALFMKNYNAQSKAPLTRVVSFLFKVYEKLFKTIFRFPKITVVMVLLTFLSVRYITPYISGDFFPASDEDRVLIELQTPQGSNLDYTSKIAGQVEDKIQKIPELSSCITTIGVHGSENATITMNLSRGDERDRSDIQIIEDLLPSLASIPDADISIIRGRIKGIDKGDMNLNVYGHDYDKMVQLSKEMQEKMEQTGYFRSVSLSYKEPKMEVCFIPNEKALMEAGLREAQVGMALRVAINGDDSNIYKENGDEYNISVRLNDQYIRSFNNLNNIGVITRKGLMPITSLGSIAKKKAMPTIIHENKERVVKLSAFIGKSNPSHIRKVLDESFKDISFEEGQSYAYAGMDETQSEATKEIVKAFLLAVILTYMLLAAILNSFSQPISIILSIVTSFVGVFYALFFLGESINISSMLGMVMLVGLVVNNSILLVDAAIAKQKEGMLLKQALFDATKERFQIILMTSLAVILGVLPQLRSITAIKSSMGAVMVGGMLASILFTFILTPISYYFIEKLKASFARLLKRNKKA